MSPPQLIIRLINILGLEVGDYHHDAIWLIVPPPPGCQERQVYQAKLEGFGQECVPGQGRRAAQKAAAALARSWIAWTGTGWIQTDDPRVWAVSWALRGPFQESILQELEIDPEEVVRL